MIGREIVGAVLSRAHGATWKVPTVLCLLLWTVSNGHGWWRGLYNPAPSCSQPSPEAPSLQACFGVSTPV